MTHRLRAFVLLAAACTAFPQRSPAPVIFKAGEGSKYEAPGEEQISGDAQELFNIAQKAEKEGDSGRAIKAYRKLVKRFPHSTLAAGSQFRLARLLDDQRDFLKAAEAYRQVVENYPRSPNFNESVEAQFRIGNIYLEGKKIKLLGIPVATSMDKAVEVFAAIVRTAPYSRWTAKAQFNIGRARENQGAYDTAIQAYEAVVEKYPSDPVAADAQYQIGYIWLNEAKGGTKDRNASTQARDAFQDFLFRYPNSEKAAQARENLKVLANTQTNNTMGIARYYDKRRNYRAAVIYYNDVIKQQPGSPDSEVAKKRVDELRAKVGEAALQPPSAAAPAVDRTKKRRAEEAAARANQPAPQPPLPPEQTEPRKPALRGGPATLAPLPPFSGDSLPPATSLSPEPSATPETTPAPTP